MTKSSIRKRLILATSAVALFAPHAGFAQTEDAATGSNASREEGGDIVVTGSRIARRDLEVASPVSVVGAQEISDRQPLTAEDLLRDLPSVRPANGPSVNITSTGSSTIDLRGIGVNRTLVLVDGRRVVPYSMDGVVDLNSIPIGLVERVDVVTGGASTVYGADAVAGVINFVLKHRYQGLQASFNNRITDRGDAGQRRVDLVAGTDFADGRGNITVAAGYSKRDSLEATGRAFSAVPISSTNGLFGGSQSTSPVLFTSPGPVALGLGTGSLGSVLDPRTGRLRVATQSDLSNSSVGTFLQTPLETYSLYGSANFDIAPDIELYGSASYVQNRVTTQLAPGGILSDSFRVPLNNAYMPAGLRTQLCSALSVSRDACDAAANATGPGSAGYREVAVTPLRRFFEYGPRINHFKSEQLQVQGGLRGDITSSLHFDVGVQYGRTQQSQLLENYGSYSRLQQALRSYTVSGSPVCSDTANGCVPFNLFGPTGSITDAMLDFIDLDAATRRRNELTVVTGSINGDLFGITSPLADKPFAFSIGAEYRRLKASADPDPAARIAGEVMGSGQAQLPFAGVITVKELFGEIIAPLVVDKPFAHSLRVEAGARYSDYNTTGSSWTWKAGGSYEPVEGVKFRGMYQVAVRSPNISELFAPRVQSVGSLAVDPCQGTSPIGNAGLTALCIATGAPSGSIGSIPSPSANQINTTIAGNASLDVERARTVTLGAVFTPRPVQGLALTVDYFRIRLKDAITTPATGDIINGCFSPALNPTYSYNGFCQLVGRNPLHGGLNGSSDTLGAVLAGSNLGVIETAGIDLGVNYRLELSQLGLGGEPGQLRLSTTGTWLDYYHFQATPNAINRDCTGYYSVNCGTPRPKWRWNSRVTYSNETFDLSLLWTHIGKTAIEPYLPTPEQPLSTPQPGGPNPASVLEAFRSIKAADYFDLNATIRLREEFELIILVENLFDKQPPMVGNAVGSNANSFPSLYDPYGRSYSVTARITL